MSHEISYEITYDIVLNATISNQENINHFIKCDENGTSYSLLLNKYNIKPQNYVTKICED